MPELKEVLDKVNTLTVELRKKGEVADEERKKHGDALGETIKAIELIQADITEQRKLYEDGLATLNRVNVPQAEVDAEQRAKDIALTCKFLRVGLRGLSDEERSLSAISDGDGGFLIPDAFENEISMKAYNMAGMRDICDTSSTASGFFQLPTLKKPVMGWGFIDKAVVAQALKAGARRKDINELVGLILVHNHELEDADASLAPRISTAMGESRLEMEDGGFLNGIGGAAQPQGLLTIAAILARHAVTGHASTLNDTIDPIEEALALIKNYRSRATIMFNSATESKYRLMKDSDGRYLWNPNVEVGTPIAMFGRPTKINESMPDIAANAAPVLVGDFSQYMVRDRRGMTMQRLDETYAESRQTGLLYTSRVSGMPKQEEAFATVKVAAS